jgi:isoleucyl-tRNA synthetase
MYYALPSWYIRTTQVKDALLRENEKTNWYPDSIKWGRYGDWLRNNIDWAVSRSRYWGTPLPIWRCAEDHQICVGSLAELGELAGRDLSATDPHRPYVDDITFACPTCGEESHRVAEVIDAWYDSGSMPFAQWGYPWAAGSEEKFATAYPADFIAEAIDQTRGWFYTLMAIGTLVFDESSYQDVVCLGHIMAEDGRKMSKHLGNILEPIPLMNDHSADAVRWFMACSGSPWKARGIGPNVLNEIVRKVLLTYWNTVAFHALYARLADWSPTADVPPVAERSVLDRWLVSETNRLVRETDVAYATYDTQKLGVQISQFVDVLSNWYVRRSRRRFWAGDVGALATLHETLEVLTRLMAPLTPFVTERVWQDVFRPVAPGLAESVHLTTFPQYDEALIDDALATHVSMAKRVVELGRSARAEAKVRTRQPLSRALVGSAAIADLDDELLAEIAEELNVGSVEPLSSAGADLVEFSAKGNFRELGKRFAKQTPVVAGAIAAADAAGLAASIKASGTATVLVDGENVEVSAAEVILSERPREGWSVVNEQGETVALDLEITPELKQAGLAREVVRMLQEARKNAGLEVSDRITVWVATTDAELADALGKHADLIAGEVLATELTQSAPSATTDLTTGTDEDLGLTYWLTKA